MCRKCEDGAIFVTVKHVSLLVPHIYGTMPNKTDKNCMCIEFGAIVIRQSAFGSMASEESTIMRGNAAEKPTASYQYTR
jgi:hypothetical protein